MEPEDWLGGEAARRRFLAGMELSAEQQAAGQLSKQEDARKEYRDTLKQKRALDGEIRRLQEVKRQLEEAQVTAEEEEGEESTDEDVRAARSLEEKMLQKLERAKLAALGKAAAASTPLIGTAAKTSTETAKALTAVGTVYVDLSDRKKLRALDTFPLLNGGTCWNTSKTKAEDVPPKKELL